MGAYTGLDLAWQKGYKKVEVEVDSEVVFKAFNGKVSNLATDPIVQEFFYFNKGIGGSGLVIHIKEIHVRIG